MHKIIVFLIVAANVFVACGTKTNPKNDSTSSNLSFDKAFEIAQQLNDEGNLDSALTMVELAIVKDSANCNAQMLKADIYFALGNFQESMKSYKSCLDQEPKNPKLWARLGKIYLNQNDLNSALKYFTQAINYDPSYADAYIGRAIVFGKQEEMDQAYLSMQTAIDFDPNNLNALLTMADWKLADSAEISIQYLTNAIRVDSNVAEHYYKRAKANQKFENYTEAGYDFLKAHSLEPNNLEYCFNLAYFYFQFEQWENAQIYFEKALALDNEDTDAILGKALCQKELGKNVEAKQSLELLLQIDPNDTDALRELENLQ